MNLPTSTKVLLVWEINYKKFGLEVMDSVFLLWWHLYKRNPGWVRLQDRYIFFLFFTSYFKLQFWGRVSNRPKASCKWWGGAKGQRRKKIDKTKYWSSIQNQQITLFSIDIIQEDRKNVNRSCTLWRCFSFLGPKLTKVCVGVVPGVGVRARLSGRVYLVIWIIILHLVQCRAAYRGQKRRAEISAIVLNTKTRRQIFTS